jgi:Tat protein secretion system quality control protein TatD with DNase activity
MLSCGAQADERPMIDAHSHLDSTYLEQLTIEDIIERLNRNKIDRILITSRNNNETLKLAKRIPGRIIPFASIYTAEADKANWFHSAES